MADVFLSPADVCRITGRKRWKAQARELARLGYRVIPSATGEPLVRVADLDADGKPAQRRGHRWDRIGGVKQLRP